MSPKALVFLSIFQDLFDLKCATRRSVSYPIWSLVSSSLTAFWSSLRLFQTAIEARLSWLQLPHICDSHERSVERGGRDGGQKCPFDQRGVEMQLANYIKHGGIKCPN